MKKPSFWLKVLLPFVLVFVVLLLWAPKSSRWGYDYAKGQPWRYETLTAQFDFPLLKTDAQIASEQAEQMANVIPYYKYSQDVVSSSLHSLSRAQLPGDSLKQSVVRQLVHIYEKGVIPESVPDELIYVQRDKRAEECPSSEVFTLHNARIALFALVSQEFMNLQVDSIFRAANVYDILQPNLIYDEQLTNIMHNRAGASISPTMGYVNAGSIIVSEGEIVTAEIVQTLDSYKKEFESNVGTDKPLSWIYFGNALVILAILVCLYFAIYFSNAMIFKDYNRFLFVLTVFTIMALVELTFIKFSSEWIFLFPFAVGALYLQAFFRTRVIYPVYIVSLLPILIYADNGAALFMIYLVSGIVTLFVFRNLSKGVKQFLAAMINFAVVSICFGAVKLLGLVHYDFLRTEAMLFVGSILAVALHPFVLLLERIFNLVSNSRLMELSDTSSGVLRSLEQKAPGTFQHSLQVMNIASAAARAIGADEFLVRAGALYHDIGKMNNPQCFVENESLVSADRDGKYHADLSPLQSAQDIIKHITDGMEIAQAHSIPAIVSDFILTHHGTTCVQYFYDKYIKEGGDSSRKAEFCYPGRKPQTKEQVILMIADSLEAASRTLKDYSAESISELVERIVRYKIADGQLDESDITIREISTVKAVIKSYLAQIHHERVKYPNRRIK